MVYKRKNQYQESEKRHDQETTVAKHIVAKMECDRLEMELSEREFSLWMFGNLMYSRYKNTFFPRIKTYTQARRLKSGVDIVRIYKKMGWDLNELKALISDD